MTTPQQTTANHDEELFEDMSVEELQCEIADLYRMKGYMDQFVAESITRQLEIAEKVLKFKIKGD